jgi:hypothetical protein
MQFGLLLGELVVLFFLSRALTSSLFKLFFLLTRSRTVALTGIIALEFPGTVVHELSHLFMAGILGVRTGKLSLVPETLRDNRIEMGSVMVAKTDPFRRYAIGLAPVVGGIVILTAVSSFYPQLINEIIHSDIASPLYRPNSYILVLLGYLTFAISNAMFSSREDLKGIVPFGIVLGFFAAGIYFIGFRIGLTGPISDITTRAITLLAQSLAVVLGVNFILLLITLFSLHVAQKILHKKII